MKKAMACALALGMAGSAVGARAGGLDCCKENGAKKAACCPTTATDGKVCLMASGIAASELAKQLTQAVGMEVRILGPSYETYDIKLCAPTPEAALAQVAEAIHGRWRRAFIFGGGGEAKATTPAEQAITVVFRMTPAATAAHVAAAQAGGIVIADKPLSGKVTFEGKKLPVGMAMDAVAAAAGLNWQPGYVIQIGPETVALRRGDTSKGIGPGSSLQIRPVSPLTHLHRHGSGATGVKPAPGVLVQDPEAQSARLAEEAYRRQQLGEWAGVFTQENMKATKRAIRDLRIRVETAIQKLESYPPQNRHLGAAMWRARYERMLADYKNLTAEQQKLVQPVLDAMKYFAAPVE